LSSAQRSRGADDDGAATAEPHGKVKNILKNMLKNMHFSAEESRLIAVMAKKGKPLHETVKSLMEALPGGTSAQDPRLKAKLIIGNG
jgi:hypothetical protein